MRSNFMIAGIIATFVLLFTTLSYAQPVMVQEFCIGDGCGDVSEIVVNYKIESEPGIPLPPSPYEIRVNNQLCPNLDGFFNVFINGSVGNPTYVPNSSTYIQNLILGTGTTLSIHLYYTPNLNSSYTCKTTGTILVEIWKL